jgi:glucose-1-phosphate adenylyltransferase
MVGSGCRVAGAIDHSILFPGVDLGENSTIRDSIIMPGVKIGKNTTIIRAIIDQNSIVGNSCRICPSSDKKEDILLIKENSVIYDNSIIHTAGIKAASKLQGLLRRELLPKSCEGGRYL